MSECKVVHPPTGREPCGKPARWSAKFGDGDAAPCCDAGRLYLAELARAHGTQVAFEPAKP